MPHRIFLPRRKKRSKFLSIKSLLVANIIVLSLVLSRVYSNNFKDLNILGFATDIRVSELLDATNTERQTVGLGTLKYSDSLSNAARNKATDMFNNNYWAHISPKGKTPWDFILAENYKYTYAGENLAKDFQKSNSVVRAWMGSPTHKENLLNKNYTEVGFAVVNGRLLGKETTLVVQMFGTPYNTAVTQKEETVAIQGDSVQLPIESEDITKEVNVMESVDKSDFIVLDIGLVTNFSYLLLIIFALALIVDGVIAYKKQYTRLTGNTISHLVMFVSAVAFIYFLKHPDII